MSILDALFGVAATVTVGLSPPSGATNPAVTQETIGSTICRRGYTATVRPAFTWTNDLKRRSLPRGSAMSDFELDHLIPLELGGHPTDLANLWLQRWDGPCGARAKDLDENRLRAAVCHGMSLRAAQAEIVRLTRDCR